MTSTAANGASSSAGVIILFTNISAHDCSLTGYPEVALLKKDHHTLDHATESVSGYLCEEGCSHPKTITVRSGRTVRALLEWKDNSPQHGGAYNERVCPDYGVTRLLITPPGGQTPTSLPAPSIPICNYALIHAVQP